MLVLIPENPTVGRVYKFRPIACCNVLYKIIAKLLASRLEKDVLDTIIDPAQSAFIKGRLMVDNILLVHELIRRHSRKRISPRCFFKVDLRKAYDLVDWSFLRDNLGSFTTTGNV
ncbi:hypothetical protein Dimus_038004 [Dionaea muscipula]